MISINNDIDIKYADFNLILFISNNYILIISKEKENIKALF